MPIAGRNELTLLPRATHGDGTTCNKRKDHFKFQLYYSQEESQWVEEVDGRRDFSYDRVSEGMEEAS